MRYTDYKFFLEIQTCLLKTEKKKIRGEVIVSSGDASHPFC
jgi:hypothetical protein